MAGLHALQLLLRVHPQAAGNKVGLKGAEGIGVIRLIGGEGVLLAGAGAILRRNLPAKAAVGRRGSLTSGRTAPVRCSAQRCTTVFAEQAGGRVGRTTYRAGQLRVGIAGGIRPARFRCLAGGGVGFPFKAGAVLGRIHAAALLLVAGPVVRRAAFGADHNIVGFGEGLLAHKALAADVIRHINKPPRWEKIHVNTF